MRKSQVTLSALASLLILLLQQYIQLIDCSNLFIIPTPTGDLRKVKANIDSSYVLSCIASGTSEEKPKALQWFSPSGKQIQPDFSQRIHTTLQGDTLRLYFEKLVASDAGHYTCKGIEQGFPTEAKILLDLTKQISFVDTLTKQFVQRGQDQLVTCKAVAQPGPEISWFRQGVYVEITNDNKYQKTNEGLAIKNAQAEDEGAYYCQASVPSSGQVKKIKIDVQVMSPPEWITSPKDTEGVLGDDVVLRCEAHAKPQPVYQWLKRGIPVAGARYSTQVGTLTIRNLRKEDTDTYTCIAENTSGKIESNAFVAVLVGPQLALMQDVMVVEGQTGSLKCFVKEAFPKATIRWKYSDTLTYVDEAGDPRVSITDDHDNNSTGQMAGRLPITGSWSTLSFSNVNRLDKRNYTCEATNKAARAERQAALEVEYAPKMLLNLEAREVYYSWLFEDQYGSSGASAQGGQAAPARAYPVRMKCLADANPPSQITWYQRGELIQPLTDPLRYRLLVDELGMSELEVQPQSIDDFGDYQCRASNRLGREERSIQLRQATVPRFAPSYKLKRVKPESIVFDIEPSTAPDADGGMPIEAFVVQWRHKEADWSRPNEKEFTVDLNKIERVTNKLTALLDQEVGPLEPDTEYSFRICAVNKPGRGEFTDEKSEMLVRTAPRRQPDPVQLISGERCGASTRCYVEWQVDSNGGSPIRDYSIRWRRVFFKDPLTNKHVDTSNLGRWSSTRIVKAPTTNYEMMLLAPDAFYEVEVLASNDIGPSASNPSRIRTLPTTAGESEAYTKRHSRTINTSLIIAGSIIAAFVLFMLVDLVCLIKSNCGILAFFNRSCCSQGKDKSQSSDYKIKTPLPKIAQHQPKTDESSSSSKTNAGKYQQISTSEENNDDKSKITIPLV